ncbi:MAG: thermonuclease family protein [Blastocatellia bacterium]|nr:thermonuclease family protein [Blastocatellia bacterium]
MLITLRTHLLAALCACLLAGLGYGQTIRGRVIAIADGDTLTVLDERQQSREIRLNGIDAPESRQEFGAAAKRALSELAAGRDALVFWSKIDKYDRIVGTVLVGSTNVNLELVRTGMAWYYRQYADEVPEIERAQYEAAEREARTDKRGLWQQLSPAPPWAFRHPEQAESLPPPALRSPAPPEPPPAGRIIGNRNSGIYHLPHCPSYALVAERNRQYFANEADAARAGFRRARNCP